MKNHSSLHNPQLSLARHLHHSLADCYPLSLTATPIIIAHYHRRFTAPQHHQGFIAPLQAAYRQPLEQRGQQGVWHLLHCSLELWCSAVCNFWCPPLVPYHLSTLGKRFQISGCRFQTSSISGCSINLRMIIYMNAR